MNILLYGDMVTKSAELISSQLTIPHKIHILHANESSLRLIEEIKYADILISMTYKADWPYPEKLKLLQVPGVGVDGIDFSALPSHVPVCRAYGHESAVSEYVLMGLLMFLHNLKNIEQSFRKGNWTYSSRTSGPFHEQLAGKNIGIVGYGAIGKTIAQRLYAMGCQLHVCNRTPVPCISPITRYWPLSELKEMVRHVDALILSVACTPETQGMINSDILKAMRPNSIFINVARGGCVNEDDLYQALQGRFIAGAMLDVWWQYPTPENATRSPGKHDWKALPNVIMTPHTSAWSGQMWHVRVNEIVENIHAIAKGMPLKHCYLRSDYAVE